MYQGDAAYAMETNAEVMEASRADQREEADSVRRLRELLGR